MKNRVLKTAIVVIVVVAMAMAATGCNMLASAKEVAEDPGSVLVTSDGEAPQPAENATPEEQQHISYDETAGKTTVEFDGQKYQPKEGMTNVLLMGVDADTTRQDVGRSDMLMLCSIDTKNNKISFISVPRDTRTLVYHLDASGNKTKEETTKINHAYAYGGGAKKYSPQNAMKATEMFLEVDGRLNIPIDKYISIDLAGLPKISSVLGGVPVTLDQDVPEVGKKGQTVELEGNDVRLFLQNRKDMSDGETTRQLHEQMFIKAMAKKIKDMGAAEAAPKLFDSFTKFMNTNLTAEEALALATILDKASLDSMDFQLLENGHGEMLGNPAVWFYIASQDEVLKKMLATYYDAA